VIGFEEHGATVQGPRGLIVERSARLDTPLTLMAWVSDDAKLTTSTGLPPRNVTAPVTLRWSKYRGPGGVTFSPARPEIQKSTNKDAKMPFSGTATTTVTFSEPGEYMLHLTANDYSGEGGGGFQCCWTTALVRVSVQE
jgi:hypothetical protein